MLFHGGHLVPLNNVVVKTADTDVLIIALANTEKLPAGINVWLWNGTSYEQHTHQKGEYEQTAPRTR